MQVVRVYKLFAIGLLCGSLMAATVVMADDAKQSTAALDEALRSNPQDKGRENRRGQIVVDVVTALEGMSDAELRRTAHKGGDSMALLAAWDFVLRADKESKEQKLNWFRGFYEGRVGLSPPAAWTNRLYSQAELKLDARQVQADAFQHCTGVAEMRRLKIGSSLAIRVHRDQAIRLDGEQLIFSSADRECAVDVSLFTALGDGTIDQISYQLDAEILVVAAIETTAGKFPIFCFDAKSGRLRWSQTAWGHLSITNTVGGSAARQSFHCLELVRDGDRILLFGATYFCYCEAYDVDEGRCALRFSTIAWYGRQLKKRREG